MREILFRGKRVDNGEWLYGFYAAEPNGRQGDGAVHLIQPLDDNGRFDILRRVAPATVGQYTGLTDKNGTKIFEGDILNENGYLFTVVYDQYWAKFKLQHDGHAIQYPEWNRGIKMEIVGNIHDNPELLTEATP